MNKTLLLLIALIVLQANLQAQEWKWYNTGLPSNNVTSIAVTDSGKLYAATLAGLASFQNNAWQTANTGVPGNPQIRRVWTYPGSLWLGTEYSGLWGFKNGVWKIMTLIPPATV